MGVVRGELKPVLFEPSLRAGRRNRHVLCMTIARDMAPTTEAEIHRLITRAVGTRLTGPLKTPVLQSAEAWLTAYGGSLQSR